MLNRIKNRIGEGDLFIGTSKIIIVAAAIVTCILSVVLLNHIEKQSNVADIKVSISRAHHDVSISRTRQDLENIIYPAEEANEEKGEARNV